MVERNAGVSPDKRIEFRIGIHLGDVVEETDGDLMGDGVNIAARLEFIGTRKPRIADDVGHQDRREFPGLAHGAIAEAGRSQVAVALAWLRFHAALEEGMEAESASPRVGSRSLSTPSKT
jgi:class 3 adenylate cyclase